MPQLDKEIFTGYFFAIFFALMSFHADSFVSENSLRINGQHFLYSQLIIFKRNLRFEKEKFLYYIDHLLEQRFRNFK